jgi:hypothetical protein
MFGGLLLLTVGGWLARAASLGTRLGWAGVALVCVGLLCFGIAAVAAVVQR